MYNAIIIGNDVSSLIAAWRTASRGVKTALITNLTIPYKFALNNYTFEIDPLPWTLSPALNLSSLFSLADKTSAMPAPSEPALQVIFPGHRIDFRQGLYDQIREFSREFPDYAERIERFYQQALTAARSVESGLSYLSDNASPTVIAKTLPQHLWRSLLWQVKTRTVKPSSDIGSVLQVLIHLFSNRTTSTLDQINACFHLTRLLNAHPFVQSSKRDILQNLRNQLVTLGVDLYEASTVSRVLTGREIEVAIHHQDRELMLSATNLIVSPKWRDFDKLCHDRKIDIWYQRYLKNASPLYYPHTIHIGLADTAIPDKMTQQVILGPIDGHEGANIGALTFIALSKAGDLNDAPAGKRALSATVFMEIPPSGRNCDHFRNAADKIMKRLDFVLPFMRENIDSLDIDASARLFIDYQDVMNPKSLYAGGLSGFLPSAGHNRVKHNVLIAGGDLFPELGFTGELLSGVRTANQLSGGK